MRTWSPRSRDSGDLRLQLGTRLLAEKLRDLRAGRDVYVPGWRLPREHRPAGAKVFRLRGDQLHPADDTLSADPNDKG